MAISMLQQSSRSESLNSSTPPTPVPYPRAVDDTRTSSLLQGRDTSRPSSTSTTQSSAFQPPSYRQESIKLPGLAALAQAAEARSTPTPTPPPPPPSQATTSVHNMSYATSAPGQGSVLGSAPPTCQNCSTSTTPLWRRDDSGSVLCNACGLFLKLHNRPRPISLKTDVIKSRNRIKVPIPSASFNNSTNANQNGSQNLSNSASPQEQSGSGSGNGSFPARPRATNGMGLAAAHPNVASSLLHTDRQSAAYAPATPASQHGAHQHPATNSREATPSTSALLQHARAHATAEPQNDPRSGPSNIESHSSSNNNIAPQHLFDSSNIDPQHQDIHIENSDLRTRVSELEVINDLFRGRVSELEAEVKSLKMLLEKNGAGGTSKRGREEGVDGLGEDGAGADAGDGEKLKRARKDEVNGDGPEAEAAVAAI